MRWLKFWAAIAAGLMAHGAVAQSADQPIPEMPEGCTLKAQSERIRLLLCAPELDDEQLSLAGRAACGEKLACGVWIWSDAADIPAEAPENHDGLTRAQVTSATAAWMAGDQMLVRIDQLNK